MLIRAFKAKRQMFLAAGALTVSALAGCQGVGQQFARPGVARGDVNAGGMATSPAFAQVAAGNRGAAQPGNTGAMMPANMTAQQYQMAAGQQMPQQYQMAAGQQMPQQYQMAAGQQMPQQYQMTAGQQMMAPGGSIVQPAGHAVNNPAIMPGTQALPQTQVMYPQQIAMPTPAPITMQMAPATQPTYMLVNGPNGPQYVLIQEVVTQSVPAAMPVPMPPPPPPAMPAPALAAPPAPAMPAPLPISTPAPAVLPPAAPTPPVAPISYAPAPELTPPLQAPTFTAPAPVFVQAPPMPTLPPPVEPAVRAPIALPPSVSAKPPTGPVLPVADVGGPSLGSYPASPAVAPAPTPVKLPPATGVVDHDIPDAPIFLPARR